MNNIKPNIQNIILIAAVIITFLPFIALAGRETDDIRQTIDELLQQEQYENAWYYIMTSLFESDDRSYLYFKLSQVEFFRGNAQEASLNFKKALDLLPAPPSTETPDTLTEQQIHIVDSIRLHNAEAATELILEEMIKTKPDCSSALYEMAYFKYSQLKISEFFDYFYRAYQISPENPMASSFMDNLSVQTGDISLVPDANFPFLSPAINFYDNPNTLPNLMNVLAKYGLIKINSVVEQISELFPEHLRPVFNAYYYGTLNDREAVEKELELLESATFDYRFDIYKRNFLLSNKTGSNTMEGIGPVPDDLYEQILFHELWLNYYQLGIDDREDLSHHKSYVDKTIEFLGPVFSSEQSREEIRNHLIGSIITTQVKNQKYELAIGLLEIQSEYLDDKSCEVAAGLCFNMGRYNEAIDWSKRRLSICEPEYTEEILTNIINFSLVIEDFNSINEALQYAKTNDYNNIVNDFNSLQDISSGYDRQDYYFIKNIPGYTVTDKSLLPWQYEKLGVCAKASAYSVLNFYDVNSTYQQISEEIDLLIAQEPNTPNLEIYDNFFKSKGFEVAYFAPVKEVAVNLVSEGYPLILLNHLCTGGITVGHVSIINGYDNRREQFLTYDTSKTECAGMDYDDLIDSNRIMLVTPGDINTLSIPKYFFRYKTLPPWEMLTIHESETFTNSESELKYWALRNNGIMLANQNDPNALQLLEEAYSIRKPNDTIVYDFLTILSLISGNNEKGIEYLERGLEIEPNNLKLLEQKVVLELDGMIGNKLDNPLIKSLLDTTNQMISINPEYATSYILKADLLSIVSLYQDAQDALTASQIFLEKYSGMKESWQKKHEESHLNATNNIKTLRALLLEQFQKEAN